MKKVILAVCLALGASSVSAEMAGAISYASNDYAAIYGKELKLGDFERWNATSGNFCGVSRLSNITNFIWTGYPPVTLRASSSGLWVLSCIHITGPAEVSLWSYEGFTRSKSAEKVDETYLEELKAALPDF